MVNDRNKNGVSINPLPCTLTLLIYSNIYGTGNQIKVENAKMNKEREEIISFKEYRIQSADKFTNKDYPAIAVSNMF